MEVITRWQKIFKASSLAQRYLKGDTLDCRELNTLKEITSIWRKRLTDISWFMRCLNDSIARQANTEDKCTDRFCERSDKIPGFAIRVLTSCMADVDLNPICANIAKDSDYTSNQ
ncbi:hypothetical protein [Microbulbifer sp. JTAC008]|uniref:hypothetical protein n=1 Tax=unclassified Microbulbifer TaxID=2619833 RepID=UPI004039C21B